MHFSTIFSAATVVAVASAHSVILNAQGDAGSPASTGFQVDVNLPRNCTSISPCQQDATIIRDAEIAANIVNQCGRTELNGNIDVGENTENALAAGAVTQVKAGSTVTVTIHQVNADGAGPYTCDLDQTSNSGLISQNLTVTNNIPGVNGLSQAKEQDFNITVTMPNDLACSGASTGNICTIRCRNNAVAGPFGGCFAVQQSDVKATTNTASNIQTKANADVIDAQEVQNKADLAGAIAANAKAGAPDAVAQLATVNSLLGVTVTTSASPVQTPIEALGSDASAAAGTATTSAATPTGTGKAGKAGRKGNKNKGAKRSLRWAKRMDSDN